MDRNISISQGAFEAFGAAVEALGQVAVALSTNAPKGACDTDVKEVSLAEGLDLVEFGLLVCDTVDRRAYAETARAALRAVANHGPLYKGCVAIVDEPRIKWAIGRTELPTPEARACGRRGERVAVFSDDMSFATGVEVWYSLVTGWNHARAYLIYHVVERTQSH